MELRFVNHMCGKGVIWGQQRLTYEAPAPVSSTVVNVHIHWQQNRTAGRCALKLNIKHLITSQMNQDVLLQVLTRSLHRSICWRPNCFCHLRSCRWRSLKHTTAVNQPPRHTSFNHQDSCQSTTNTHVIQPPRHMSFNHQDTCHSTTKTCHLTTKKHVIQPPRHMSINHQDMSFNHQDSCQSTTKTHVIQPPRHMSFNHQDSCHSTTKTHII